MTRCAPDEAIARALNLMGENIAHALSTLDSADHGQSVATVLAPAVDRLADEVASASADHAEALTDAADTLRGGMELIAAALNRIADQQEKAPRA